LVPLFDRERISATALPLHDGRGERSGHETGGGVKGIFKPQKPTKKQKDKRARAFQKRTSKKMGIRKIEKYIDFYEKYAYIMHSN